MPRKVTVATTALRRGGPAHTVEANLVTAERFLERAGAMLICFDVNFPERWREAKQLGAEIVFWATVDEGGLRSAAHARQNEYYVVSSCYGPAWRASILDVTGHELTGTSQRDDLAWAQI